MPNINEIGIQLSTCAYHLRAASEAFSKAVEAIKTTIDGCATQSNDGDARVGNSTVMWGELSRTRGISVNMEKLADFGNFLSYDVASIVEDTARLASTCPHEEFKRDEAPLVIAATVSSVISNLFRIVGEFGTKYPPSEIEKDVMNLRQAKPFLVKFCSEPFGEFHRALVSGDRNSSISMARDTASSTTTSRKIDSVSSVLPPLGAPTMMMTPQQDNKLNTNTNNNNTTATSGAKKKKKKKRRGAGSSVDKQSSRGSISDHDNNDDAPTNKTVAVPNPTAAVEDQLSNTASQAALSQQSSIQLVSNQEFSFISSTEGDSSANNSNLLRFDGNSIESSLPTSIRSKYSTFLSNFLPIASLLSSRQTYLSNESTTINQVPSRDFFLELVRKSMCDAVLDTEIGLELSLGLALPSTNNSSNNNNQQQKVPDWKFPLPNQSYGFAMKDIPLTMAKSKWISIFALFSDRADTTVINFVRQDVFIRGSGSIIEVGLQVSFSPSSSMCTIKPCLQSRSGSGNDGDPLGLAFVRFMKDIIGGTADQLRNDPRFLVSSSSLSKQQQGNNKSSKNNNNKRDLLSLDASSHQERERKSQQNYESLQEEKKKRALEVEEQQNEANKGSLTHGASNVIKGVGSSVFGVVKGIAMTPVNAVTTVAGAAANTVKDQQIALFKRNFPEFAEGEEVIDLYNCALSDDSGPLKQGYLFLLKKRCCFCASVLTAKFSVQWRDISKLEKKKFSGFFNNSIELELLSGQKYFLTSFIDRDSALNRIFEFWTGRVNNN